MTSRGAKYWNSGSIPLIAPEILGDIISDVADLSVVISETGTILSVLANPGQELLHRLDHWEGRDIRTVLTGESIAKFAARLTEFLDHRYDRRPIELNHTDGGGRWDFPISYTFHRIGPDGAILMLGRDMRPIVEMQQQLVRAQMALERDYETQREFDIRFRVLMETTREAVVFVSMHTGRISDVNQVAATVLGRGRDDLVGSPLSAEIEADAPMAGPADLVARLAAQATTDRTVPVPVRLRRAAAPARITATLFRAAGDRLLLCRIEAGGESAAQAEGLAHHLNALYLHGSEAIVFTDAEGIILAANERFLDLTNAAHELNVKGRGLDDFLQRGSIDLRVMKDNAARAGRMRLYATRVISDFGSPRGVDISTTAIEAGADQVFAFVIRDSVPGEGTTGASLPATEDNTRSVKELVGSATLKDIVAETTNVVERLCIETALELTANNRVAAADMLGLSRQSLYVKLRKYDLLAKDERPD